jgi:hypothetical protein
MLAKRDKGSRRAEREGHGNPGRGPALTAGDDVRYSGHAELRMTSTKSERTKPGRK